MSASKIEDKKVQLFLEKLEELYKFVEEFCKEQNLEYRYEDIEIYEEFGGRYKTKELFVYKDGEFLFKLKPVGAYIIAADGRVDLIGKFDEKRLIFLTRQHELVTKLEENGKILSEKRTPLYSGFRGAGWYIALERKRVTPLSKVSLCQVLEEVSEFRCS